MQFKLNAVSAAMLASLVSAPLLAAPDDTQEDMSDVEIIEVTGFKGSLKKAMNAKRFNDGVSDSIHAEDVGKSTDQNIADALSRVTGVSVQETDGEGAQISVRGAGPNLNQISMNGVALTSGLGGNGDSRSNSQAVDLSTFSSDILSSIDVQKTSAADHDEGSLGASVVLKTVRPLDLKKDRLSVEVQGRYNDFADEVDRKFSGSVSHKFLDETLGVILTVSDETQSTREDRITTDWRTEAISIADNQSYDVATGKAIRVLGEGQTEDDLNNWNPDTQIAVQGPLNALGRTSTSLNLNLRERERQTANLGLQFRPFESSDIQLDFSHSNSKVSTDEHRINMSYGGGNNPSPNDDLTKLRGIDLTTNTIQADSGRDYGGAINRATGNSETTTNVISLDYEQQLTDSLTMNFRAGYSNTEYEEPDYIRINTATWGKVQSTDLADRQEEEIERVGYNCSGSDCTYETGQTPAIFDPVTGAPVKLYSAFNPYDLDGNNLGGITMRDNHSDDTSKSAFLDFDWQIDALDNITSIEFGGKLAKRERDVHIQNSQLLQTSTLISGDESFALQGMGSITMKDMMQSDSSFPVDDFLDGMTSGEGKQWADGWAILDPYKALTKLTGRNDSSNLKAANDPFGSSKVEVDTKALYAKINFEAFDGDLTGNIGLRYVKDETEAMGNSGVTLDNAAYIFDPYTLIKNGLANTNLPQCDIPEWGEFNDDGLPYRPYEPTNFPAPGTCSDWHFTHATIGWWEDGMAHTGKQVDPNTVPRDADGNWVLPGGVDTNRIISIDYDTAGNAMWDTLVMTDFPTSVTNVNGDVLTDNLSHNDRRHDSGLMPWIDRSTLLTSREGQIIGQDIYKKVGSTSDKGDYSVYLPSLNLNYAINDEMMVRFATSKTMTRPTFSGLNPALTLNEGGWAATANGRVGNTQLEPLKSTNVDLSWEWYFGDTDMISVGLFYKDMTDFEENVQTPWFYRDTRSLKEGQSLDNLLIAYDEEGEAEGTGGTRPWNSDCMPARFGGGETRFMRVECHKAFVNTVTNGEGATIKGMEFTYTQNYNFLPGLLSGLGMNFNYTYQDSESDEQEVENSDEALKPLPQPYTPKHSANTTLFWQQDGLELRLAHRYTGDQLVQRGLAGGQQATWEEESHRLDFSSNYQISEMFSLTFHALNLTDEERRIFLTDAGLVEHEGNALNDSVPTNRTAALYKSGRQFRIGLRATF